IWRVDAGQKNDLAHYPLYKDVPYSKRLEVLPFDPELYPENNPERGSAQENPARLHFFDDTQFDGANTDTQAFITHTDEVILLSI
ncbi:lipase family protein, partial [Pseudomonas sp. SDO528_S397]